MKVLRVKQEYLDARYEYRFVCKDGTAALGQPLRRQGGIYPVRGNEFDAQGNLISIFPFEEVDL